LCGSNTNSAHNLVTSGIQFPMKPFATS
jgi:hypothetical protein